jgi:hypothetical protein
VEVFLKLEILVEEFNSNLPDNAVIPLDHIINWINMRLYRLRSSLASSNNFCLDAALEQFSMNHRSFRSVETAVVQQNRAVSRPDGPPHKIGMPKAISELIPRDENGKRSCLRYWTHEGCKGKGRNCDTEYLAHTRPKASAIDEKLLKYIKENVGHIRKNAFQDQE